MLLGAIAFPRKSPAGASGLSGCRTFSGECAGARVRCLGASRCPRERAPRRAAAAGHSACVRPLVAPPLHAATTLAGTSMFGGTPTALARAFVRPAAAALHAAGRRGIDARPCQKEAMLMDSSSIEKPGAQGQYLLSHPHRWLNTLRRAHQKSHPRRRRRNTLRRAHQESHPRRRRRNTLRRAHQESHPRRRRRNTLRRAHQESHPRRRRRNTLRRAHRPLDNAREVVLEPVPPVPLLHSDRQLVHGNVRRALATAGGRGRTGWGLGGCGSGSTR